MTRPPLCCLKPMLSCYEMLALSLGFRRPLGFPLILINIQICA